MKTKIEFEETRDRTVLLSNLCAGDWFVYFNTIEGTTGIMIKGD